jgi:hypothetical protein
MCRDTTAKRQWLSVCNDIIQNLRSDLTRYSSYVAVEGVERLGTDKCIGEARRGEASRGLGC